MKVTHGITALVLAGAAAALPMHAQVAISVNIAPPMLPVYDQPSCPADGDLWAPGYWAWDTAVSDFYWVPGTWVEAPQVGYLWTPGYWGFVNGAYLWHVGYWGSHIGFYGGVNYGYGYFGTGYEGGYWNGGHLFYNTAISHVDLTVIHNTYARTVAVENNSHLAFNGPGGTSARPSAGEQAAFREVHLPPTSVQMQHAGVAQADRSQFASTDHGQPAAMATARPATSGNGFRSVPVVNGMRAGGPVGGGISATPTSGKFTGNATPNGIPTSYGAPLRTVGAPGNIYKTPQAAPPDSVRTIAPPAAGFLRAQPGTPAQATTRQAFGTATTNPGTVRAMPAPDRPIQGKHSDDRK